MAQTVYELTNNMTGLSETPVFEKEEEGKISIAYEAERCTAAWLEVEDQGIWRKVSIMPLAKNGNAPEQTFKEGSKFKVIASIGRNGFFRAHIYY